MKCIKLALPRAKRDIVSRGFATTVSSIGDPYTWDYDSHWKDMFQIDALLSDEDRMIRYAFVLETVRFL